MAAEIFVDREAADEYLCIICLDVMNKPAQVGCTSGHIFCRECIDPICRSSSTECPICRSSFDSKSIVEIPYIQRKIDDLFVICPHHHSLTNSSNSAINSKNNNNTNIDIESNKQPQITHNDEVMLNTNHNAHVQNIATTDSDIEIIGDNEDKRHKAPTNEVQNKEEKQALRRSARIQKKQDMICGKKRKRMNDALPSAKRPKLNETNEANNTAKEADIHQEAITAHVHDANNNNNVEDIDTQLLQALCMSMTKDEIESNQDNDVNDLNKTKIESKTDETEGCETQMSADSECCDWSGRYGDLQKHLKECIFEETRCIYSGMGCKQHLLRKDMDIHKKECEYYPVQCTHCTTIISRGYLTKHMSDDCMMTVIKCDNCSIELERKALHKHLRYECGEMLIECEYSKYGCNLMKRKEKEAHYKQCMQHHLKLVTLSHNKLEETVCDLALRITRVETLAKKDKKRKRKKIKIKIANKNNRNV